MTTKTELAEARLRIEDLEQALEEKHKHLLAQEKERQTYQNAAATNRGRIEELEKALSKQEKELNRVLDDRSRLERNLARALGYIDRVLEAERPEITWHSVGDVCTETNNYHGPQMEEPPIQHDGLPGLRRSW